METHEAFKKFLIAWAIMYDREYYIDGNRDVLNDSLDNIMESDQGSIKDSMITIFGTTLPDSNQRITMADKYGDWVIAIWANLEEILEGKRTFEEVIYEQSIRETWL